MLLSILRPFGVNCLAPAKKMSPRRKKVPNPWESIKQKQRETDWSD